MTTIVPSKRADGGPTLEAIEQIAARIQAQLDVVRSKNRLSDKNPPARAGDGGKS